MNKEHTVKIFCTNTGAEAEVPVGMSLSEVASHLGVKLKYSVVGATVNNEFTSLSYSIFQPKRITFFDVTHPEGMRNYYRSAIMMLIVAVEETMPGARVHALRTISGGLYCEIIRNGNNRISDSEIERIRDYMHQLQQQALPIECDEIETEEAVKLLDQQSSTPQLLTQRGEIYTHVHSLAGHSQVFYGDLVPNTSIVDVFDLVPFFEGVLLRMPKPHCPTEVSEITKQDKMFEVLTEYGRWQKLLGINHLADLNKGIEIGSGNSIIQVAEALHEKKISVIADMIAARAASVKVVLIAGPSSSGKTTFSKRLATQLVVNGIYPHTLSIDNYFVNREDTPRDADGDYDYEALEAVDVAFFNEQLSALTRGEEVELPKFDFASGSRYFDGEKMKLGENHVLIIEGTHGLSPKLTAQVPDGAKFKIYIAPLAGVNIDEHTRLATTDNRLIRRIVRDYKYRANSAEATIARWPSVRRGEDKYIYPYQEQADVMFNSASFYELSMLKVQASPLLRRIAPNSPHYAEARRLLKFLGYVKPLDSATVPPTSILREFLGGSSFVY